MTTNYERFIAANQSLMDCFASVPAEQFSAMSKADQDNVCRSEANAVRQFIQNGTPNFRNILAERIASFDAKHE